MPTKIEWATETWNPITGCTPISEGCRNCYAARMAKRLAGRYGYPDDEPFRITFHPSKLEQPIRWRKPRLVFVCSMGDLFHDRVSEAAICRVLSTAEKAPQHTYLFLTKRPERARDLLRFFYGDKQPHRNFWVGVTAEDQDQADRRISVLRQIPAAFRFVSVEPMLGPFKLKGAGCQWCFGAGVNPATGIMCPQCGFDWVICGAETGPGARPLEVEWVLDLQRQCADANVPFFFKKWGARNKYGQPYGADGHIDGVLCRDMPSAI